MKCPNCGKEIVGNSQFCEYCGTQISDSLSNVDKQCLSIFRVGAEYETILASYKARKKCYKLTKESGTVRDYKLHVQQLQLDHYPSEFKKSLVGESYLKWLKGCIGGIAIFFLAAVFGWIAAYDNEEWFFLAIPASMLLIVCIIIMVRKRKKAINKILEIKNKNS